MKFGIRNRFLRATLAALLVALAAPPEAHGQDAAQRAPRQSWTADRRAFGEGDVLTVVLDDRTFASQHTGTSASASRSRDASLAGSQNIINRPGIPNSVGAGVETGTRGESRNRGDATRESRFYGEMSVRVVGVEPSGMLRVQGTKRVRLDNSTQDVVLAGLVRPQDITSSNVVESWRIADLDLRYASRGSLGKPRSGILWRLVGWLWP
jgi:flagellar L-ring protein FlgH